MLSGFLIGGILLDARESPHYFRTFYIRRAYRIFPLYAAVTTVFLVRHLPFHFLPGSFGNFSPLTIPWASYATLTQNFWMAKVGWFGLPAMAVTWSLAVEEQFYLTIPWVIRKVRRKLLVFVMISVVIGAPLLRVFLRHRFAKRGLCLLCTDAMSRRRALPWGVSSVAGPEQALVEFVADQKNHRLWDHHCPVRRCRIHDLQGIRRQYCAASEYCGIFLAGAVLFLLFTHCGFAFEGQYPAVSMPKMADEARYHRLLHLSDSRALGSGWPTFARIAHLPQAAWLPGGLLGIAATLSIASISWKFFEKPLLRRGHKHQY